MKCLTIVITLFLIRLWCSILFLDRRPKHCHWDFALIVIVKITLFSLLFLAVWSTRRSPTCFGVIWSVFNSLCILNNSRDKFEDTEILYWAPFSYKPPPPPPPPQVYQRNYWKLMIKWIATSCVPIRYGVFKCWKFRFALDLPLVIRWYREN